MRRTALFVASFATLALSGCNGDDDTVTVTVEDRERVERVQRFAYRELERLSQRTCAAIPRRVLGRHLSRASADRASDAGRRFTPNDLGLLFAEQVSIQRLRLQQAAYDGCIAGVKAAARDASGDGKGVRLAPTPESSGASRTPLEPSVVPQQDDRMGVIQVSFASRVRLGATGDGRRRGYYLVARRDPPMSGCVQHREGHIDRGRPGRRVTGRLDPRRGKGGLESWCRGAFRGEVRYYDGFACPAAGRCQEPGGFDSIDRRVGSFSFRIE